MALSPGTRLGPYEILSPLGAGGMGEVYRAKHLKLGRQVAIKVLPGEMASDPERLQRFEREAQAASALNHPNIVTIYDIDAQDGTHFIAMELVEGQTLRDRLRDGPLPTDETLRIARQIARGLSKAHAVGIVHRDLKPANLMIADDGLVKILDFGLAKLSAPVSDVGSELTTAQEVTRAGMVLGTAPYMSPEQAAGRPVDFRSDQFSFGSILYEMATGRRAFERDTTPQTLAAIIEAEPEPVGRLNERVPASLVGLIARCLSKAPEERYASTAALEEGLERAPTDAGPSSAPPSRRWRLAAGLAVLGAVGAVALYWISSRFDTAEPVATSLAAVPLTSYLGSEEEPSFSPDGSQVAFSWNGEGRDNPDIYVTAIGSAQPLRLTSDPARDGSPAWSPDGSQIAFLRERPEGGSEVLSVPPTGGAERRLVQVEASVDAGLGWSPDGRLLAVADRSTPEESLGLILLDVDTGSQERLTSPSPVTGGVAGVGDAKPVFSPDGRTVAFWRGGRAYVVPATGGDLRELAPSRSSGRVAWTPGGHDVVFAAVPLVREGAPPRPSQLGGSPVLWRMSAAGGPARQLSGSANAEDVAVSRERNRLAYTQRALSRDIWRLDLRPQRSADEIPTRLISNTRGDGNPQFSPDDERVAFTSGRSGFLEIWVADKNGGNLLRLTFLGEAGGASSPRWSPDGKNIAFNHLRREENNWDVYVVGAAGGPPRRVTTAPSQDFTPSWSSDGRWMYFSSNRSGEWQVWKVPSDGGEEERVVQVTRHGGYAPIASTDGRDLYFSKKRSGQEDPENSIWRVPAEGGDEEVLIESLGSSYCNWDATAEGIYFVDRDTSAEGTPWVIKVLALDSRRVSVVSPLPHPPQFRGPAFSMSSDGRSALFTYVEATSDIMLVENFR